MTAQRRTLRLILLPAAPTFPPTGEFPGGEGGITQRRMRREVWDHNSPSCKAGCLVGHCASAFPLEGNDRPAGDTALKPFAGCAHISPGRGISWRERLNVVAAAGRSSSPRGTDGPSSNVPVIIDLSFFTLPVSAKQQRNGIVFTMPFLFLKRRQMGLFPAFGFLPGDKLDGLGGVFAALTSDPI